MNKMRVYDVSKWLHSVLTYVLHNFPVLFRIEVVIIWIVKPSLFGFLGAEQKGDVRIALMCCYYMKLFW